MPRKRKSSDGGSKRKVPETPSREAQSDCAKYQDCLYAAAKKNAKKMDCTAGCRAYSPDKDIDSRMNVASNYFYDIIGYPAPTGNRNLRAVMTK